MTFLPILIDLITIFVIIVFMVKVIKNKKYLFGNRALFVCSIYFVILLLCAGFEAVYPSNKMPTKSIVENHEIEKESKDLYDAAVEGEIDKVDPSYIRQKWNYDYRKHQLSIELKSGEFMSTQIVVEKRKMNDSKIEAVFYKSRSSFNGKELTQRIRPLRIELLGDTLTITQPKAVKMEYNEFNDTFAVTQFTGEKLFNHDLNFNEGQGIIYLRIPKNLEITDNASLNIQFIQ